VVGFPVSKQFTRSGIVIAAGGVDLAIWMVLRRRRKWLIAAAVVHLVAAAFLLLPGRAYDAGSLRSAYVAALGRYEGTRYVWGGENHLGVDCSGLLRAALVEAHFVEGVRTFNPRLVRQGLWYWWHDASAREMSDGYRLSTAPVGKPGLLTAVGSQMEAGDFAVTADGSHVLAYLGDGRWIEADPYVLRVLRFGSGEESQWWNSKVVPGRWKGLW
jgi:cell wall-associated NlpC family hydrolase